MGIAGSALLALAASGGAASADEDRPFATLYTTMTEPAGEGEMEQTFAWKTGHAEERYNEIQSRSEFEYGLGEGIQGELALTADLAQTREHTPPGPLETERTIGVAGELIGRVLDPHTSAIGLAFYVEPSWSTAEQGIEMKALLQKNYLGDRLVTVVNLNVEDNWVRGTAGHRESESALELDLGAAWKFDPYASVGLELDNERAFSGEIIGSRASQRSSSLFLGPTLTILSDPWSLTIGVQTQLPLASGRAGEVAGGYASATERLRAILRVSAEL